MKVGKRLKELLLGGGGEGRGGFLPKIKITQIPHIFILILLYLLERLPYAPFLYYNKT